MLDFQNQNEQSATQTKAVLDRLFGRQKQEKAPICKFADTQTVFNNYVPNTPLTATEATQVFDAALKLTKLYIELETELASIKAAGNVENHLMGHVLVEHSDQMSSIARKLGVDLTGNLYERIMTALDKSTFANPTDPVYTSEPEMEPTEDTGFEIIEADRED